MGNISLAGVDAPKANAAATSLPTRQAVMREIDQDLIFPSDGLQAVPPEGTNEVDPDMYEVCKDTRAQVNQLLRIVEGLNMEIDSLRSENGQAQTVVTDNQSLSM